MDFSKLSQNEKLAVYGSVALIVGGVVGYSYGLTALGILAALAMLVLVFLPQFSPNVSLPGSRGSLMVAIGGLAGVAMVLALLSALSGALLINTNFRDLFFLVAVAGGLLMAWAGWQEFQAEGGKFQVGTSAGAASSPPAASEAAEEAAAEPAARTDEAPAASDQPPVASEPRAPYEPPPAASEPRAEDDRPNP